MCAVIQLCSRATIVPHAKATGSGDMVLLHKAQAPSYPAVVVACAIVVCSSYVACMRHHGVYHVLACELLTASSQY